ncbi:MAG: hypothetical protein HQ581_17065 [Planctomycetes bacterium]|nr:hypothetical protein [Planctomycetota bacterium]
MGHHDSPPWLTEAAGEFDRHKNRGSGVHVATCLRAGLTVLRDSLFLRIHHDVDEAVGRDSMLMPVSELKTKQRALEQIEAYLIAESAAAAEKFGYLGTTPQWYFPWLARLRMHDSGLDEIVLSQAENYLDGTSEERHRAFSDELGRLLPGSRRAPLVLFRLVPLAIQLATACAFEDRDTAATLRRDQLRILPAISDCRQCRGRVLECVEPCRACGNPLWKHQWLTAVD